MNIRWKILGLAIVIVILFFGTITGLALLLIQFPEIMFAIIFIILVGVIYWVLTD